MIARIKAWLTKLAKKHLGLVSPTPDDYDPLYMEFGQLNCMWETSKRDKFRAADAVAVMLEGEDVTVKMYSKVMCLRFVPLDDNRESATYKNTITIQYETKFKD